VHLLAQSRLKALTAAAALGALMPVCEASTPTAGF